MGLLEKFIGFPEKNLSYQAKLSLYDEYQKIVLKRFIID